MVIKNTISWVAGVWIAASVLLAGCASMHDPGPTPDEEQWSHADVEQLLKQDVSALASPDPDLLAFDLAETDATELSTRLDEIVDPDARELEFSTDGRCQRGSMAGLWEPMASDDESGGDVVGL